MNIRSSSVSKRSAQFSLRKQPIFLRGVFQNSGRDCGGNVAKHIREHIVQFKVRYSKAVLCPVFLTSCKVSEFPTIAHQISKLSNIRRGIKPSAIRQCLKMSAIHLASRLSVFLPRIDFTYFGLARTILPVGSRML